MLDIKNIEGLTSLPEISQQQTLDKRADAVLAVMTEEDLSNPPSFLKVLSNSSSTVEDLKKKKKGTLYGTNDDLYSVCYVKVVSAKSMYEVLEAAGDQTRILLGDKVTSIHIHFSDSLTAENVTTFLTGIALTNYKYVRKSYIGVNESAQFKRINSIVAISKNLNLQDEHTNVTLQTTKYSLFCRQILSLRPLDANPETMLGLCKDLAKAHSNVSIETIVDQELQSKGLNLIYSVGRGAARRPCLVILKYEGNKENKETVALVGKGVCFDAGGLNLKPTGAIEEMWCDKGGACTVLAAFKACVELKLPVNVVCAMAYVENLVGSDAYHPSDIIKSYKGLTVDIGNTDAEGRLILADAMTYTQEIYKPSTLIELSTLTGAIRIALGLTTAGLFSNSDKLVGDLLQSSTETCERLWRLPIFEEHRSAMKGVYADLNNIGGRGMGGASTAGAFLENFVEQGVEWAHIDIAGTALSTEKFVYSEGATGFGVRLLINYLVKKFNTK